MCDCITKVNTNLKGHGIELDIAFPLDTKTMTPLANRVYLRTKRLDGRRGKTMGLTALFCPFCGQKVND